ncbi:MAG: radical SAM-associated putative lipoprotein [Bacteroidales bacterium]|nr:radical SAM-associated putative lipoprotein [Bacteroidales bacterium]
MSLYKYLLGGLLALLGLTACSKVIKAAYGSPYARLNVDARVVDQSNKPVKDARLIVRTSLTETSYSSVMRDTVINGQPSWINTTNETGRIYGYTESFSEPDKDYTYIVYRSNLNPQLSGKYEDDSVKVVPAMVEKGDGNWYRGTFKMSGTVKLKEKAPDE